MFKNISWYLKFRNLFLDGFLNDSINNLKKIYHESSYIYISYITNNEYVYRQKEQSENYIKVKTFVNW